jgi:hypothetical protein
MATKKPVPTTHRWEITLIRERGKFLGFFEATDEASAIEEAIKVFQITNPEQQKRLIARRVQAGVTLVGVPPLMGAWRGRTEVWCGLQPHPDHLRSFVDPEA